MTDAWLMEADCIHGAEWFECDQCPSQVEGERPMSEQSCKIGSRDGKHVTRWPCWCVLCRPQGNRRWWKRNWRKAVRRDAKNQIRQENE